MHTCWVCRYGLSDGCNIPVSHALGTLPLQSPAHLGNVVHLGNGDACRACVCLSAFPQILGRRKYSAATGGASNPTHCLQSEPTYHTSKVRDVQNIRSDQATAAQMVAGSHIKQGQISMVQSRRPYRFAIQTSTPACSTSASGTFIRVLQAHCFEIFFLETCQKRLIVVRSSKADSEPKVDTGASSAKAT